MYICKIKNITTKKTKLHFEIPYAMKRLLLIIAATMLLCGETFAQQDKDTISYLDWRYFYPPLDTARACCPGEISITCLLSSPGYVGNLQFKVLQPLRILVTLQYQMYPLGDLHHTFVHWKPYNATPYNANLMRESQYDLSFQTVDKLTPKHIIAAGGDYWFMKDILYDDPSTTCYKTATQQVSGLQLSSPVLNSNNYGNFSLYLTPIPTGSINPVTLNLDCNTP